MMCKIILAVILGSILFTGYTQGVPLRVRRQIREAETTTTAVAPQTDSPSKDAPVEDLKSNEGRSRQPFSITGYSEDFKRGYVNPGPETLKQRLRVLDLDNNAADAPTNLLIEKPFIWVIPYNKVGRQQKAIDIAAPEILETTTQDFSDIIEITTDTILNSTPSDTVHDP